MENLKKMDKKTATEKLDDIKFRIISLNKEKAFEIEDLMKQRIYPLLEQINQITEDIKHTADCKYIDVLTQLDIEKVEIENVVDKFKIEEANELWYPEGTVVNLWKKAGSIFRKEVMKSDSKGIVEIYDGTQEMPSIPSWKLPKKGDIIVRHIKKNGMLGLKFDHISDYGILKPYFPYWFSEEDTPNDNLVIRKLKNEEN